MSPAGSRRARPRAAAVRRASSSQAGPRAAANASGCMRLGVAAAATTGLPLTTVGRVSTGVQETLRIATPEGVSLELPLAGVGSRFVALFVDTLLEMLVFIAVIVLLIVTGADGFAVFAVTGVTVFALLFIYPVAFELLAGGRTPGKRWSSLRVVCDDGSPVTFRSSALRNLVRLVDVLPGMYLVGAVTIFATRRNQRLG